jgi:hypothetical protein
MSQDIEIDPDSRTITYYEKPTVESIKEHLDAGGLAIGVGQARALLDEIDRLRKLVPPESERGPGFVGQGSWSVYAEKVAEERDELRDELSSLCEEIRILKEENDELKEVSGILNREILKENSELHRINSGLQEEVTRCGAALSSKNEHANIHYGHDEFLGIDGYGPFSLKQVSRDEWEIKMLKERVILYNKKGRRVRAQISPGDNHESDW